MQEAKWYQSLEQGLVECLLCPHNCTLAIDQSGACQVRINKEGKLMTETYAQVSAVAVDPIEKKPLFHFYPGSDILSLGTVGCNLSCKFCQNYQLAHQHRGSKESMPSQAVVELAKKYNSIGVAYTYSEPIICFEYILDTAKLIKEAGMKNVLVTNGTINREPLEELLPYIDALNIDLKSFREQFYQEQCNGHLTEVKQTIKLANKPALVEVTTLLIPGFNDSETEIRELVDWLAKIDQEIPLHFSRYFPKYKLQAPPTPMDTLLQAKQIAEEKLNYVYLGNVSASEHRNTYCYQCGELVIDRSRARIKLNLKESSCFQCGTKINVIF
ncbi:AmmeMemoRadiSam system radical SAM enzyme [Fuchsiella alkaliacetigena]|uniref:AmmeMemoRadiSam system radical SAM enzyme n=1 Tax=Fuchsiella alkaliacetigena TaxID=957042 RepID=UPI00200B765D|nr:AmmeMemoRadiSam system radical SAM enzyme [Fuchsiella alkaliacetigena]MCK8824383.1 AmmeMemoRadiSam system radical SAM enzyme [Fuchsiella alkaliacetigena]